jgi:dTDP-glucose pyrophosphorylase
MKAVILAAGEGVRMRPLTATRPKGMIPLANKPILEHLVVTLKRAGFHEILLLVGYNEEMVRGYFGNGERWGVEIDYVRQPEQLGTGHAVSLLQSSVSDPFLHKVPFLCYSASGHWAELLHPPLHRHRPPLPHWERRRGEEFGNLAQH